MFRIAFVTLLAVACGGGNNNQTNPGPDGGSALDGSTMMDPGGPIVLSFAASASTLTEGQSVTFSIVLTHPDGTDALAGGTLISPDGAVTYGPFDSGTQKGAYGLTLSWAQINQTLEIDFTTATPRTFAAQFFDQKGKKTVATVDITLTCNGLAACAGACVDLSKTHSNCGTCGHACTTPGSQCIGGLCVHNLDSDTRDSCDTVCGTNAWTCTACNASYTALAMYETVGYSIPACDWTPDASETDSSGTTFTFTSISCCCEVP
jgi:hypothetical protein